MPKADASTEIERMALSIEEAAAALGIDKGRLGAMVRVGRVPHIQLGNRVLIGKVALEQWLTRECMAAVGAASDGDLGKVPVAPVRRIQIGARAQSGPKGFAS